MMDYDLHIINYVFKNNQF